VNSRKIGQGITPSQHPW